MSSTAIVPPRRLERMEAWVSGHWDLVLGTVAGAFFAASGVVVDMHFPKGGWYPDINPAWPCIAFGSALFLLAGVSAAKRVNRMTAIRDDLALSEMDRARMQSQLDVSRNSINRIMYRLCQQFGSAMHAGTKERVSVYAAHPGEFFVRLARCSSNPNYEASGRTKYPKDEGIVGEAWADKFAVRTISQTRCPDDGVWPREMALLSGISKKTLKAMKMRSKVLYAMRITNVATGKPCAVLVFESTSYLRDLRERFEAEGSAEPEVVFRSIFDQDLGAALVDAVGIASTLVEHLDPDLATQEGF